MVTKTTIAKKTRALGGTVSNGEWYIDCIFNFDRLEALIKLSSYLMKRDHAFSLSHCIPGKRSIRVSFLDMSKYPNHRGHY